MKKNNEGDCKNLYNKLKFAITFRALAFSLIVLTYVLLKYQDITRYYIFIFFFTAFAIFITILYYAILFFLVKKDNYKFLVFFGYFQLSLDFIVITLIVIIGSSSNDKFIFLYYLLILIAGFIFLKSGVLIYGTASSLAIGISADLHYYFEIGSHYFLYNPDKLLLITSSNILGVLIFTWMLYRFSYEFNGLSIKIIEKDEFIKKSQNFNRELFNSFSQGIIVADDNFNIIFINEAALKIFNFNTERNFNNKTGVVNNSNIKVTDVFENFPVGFFLKKENRGERRFELNHKNMLLGFDVTELAEEERSIGNYILLFKDITYIKELEMESRINESLKTAGKFAGWLAHEIRNPLSAINTSAYVLDSGYSDIKESDRKRLINIIKIESERLNNLVADFLGSIKSKSTAASGNSENFNLYQLINEIILKYASGTEVKIHNSVGKEEKIYSEKNRIIQMFSNLIQNAVQSVEISLSNSKKGSKKIGIVRIGLKKENKTNEKNIISITVADNGEGMDDFTLRNASKPLFTTKENGFGLGLSIVYSIAESFGGCVSMVSRKSIGTLIKIDMPIKLAGN